MPVEHDSRLEVLWKALIEEYFPDRRDLESYHVRWSRRRQRRVLASVSIRRRIVNVAQELKHPDHNRWLAPLLYHEMCHAVIGEGVSTSAGRRQWHGRDFKVLEARHPEIRALDRWISSGGWRRAVFSARARAIWAMRKNLL